MTKLEERLVHPGWIVLIVVIIALLMGVFLYKTSPIEPDKDCKLIETKFIELKPFHSERLKEKIRDYYIDSYHIVNDFKDQICEILVEEELQLKNKSNDLWVITDYRGYRARKEDNYDHIYHCRYTLFWGSGVNPPIVSEGVLDIGAEKVKEALEENTQPFDKSLIRLDFFPHPKITKTMITNFNKDYIVTINVKFEEPRWECK